MGDYTLINIEATLDASHPQYAHVRDILSFLMGEWAKPGWTQDDYWRVEKHVLADLAPLPAHEFFMATRWTSLLVMSSAYFEEPTERRIAWPSFYAQANIKNYADEIGKFIDWIRPYVTRAVGFKRFNGSSELNAYFMIDQSGHVQWASDPFAKESG